MRSSTRTTLYPYVYHSATHRMIYMVVKKPQCLYNTQRLVDTNVVGVCEVL